MFSSLPKAGGGIRTHLLEKLGQITSIHRLSKIELGQWFGIMKKNTFFSTSTKNTNVYYPVALISLPIFRSSFTHHDNAGNYFYQVVHGMNHILGNVYTLIDPLTHSGLDLEVGSFSH